MTTHPRILVLSPNLRIGGVERSLLGLLEALLSQGHDVTLFLNSHDGEFLPLLPKGVKLLPSIPAYGDLDRPIARVLFSPRPWMAVARLTAKLVTAIRRLTGHPGDLAPRAAAYCLAFMPKVPGSYDIALGFLRPHEMLLDKVRATVKVGWVHTDYTTVETGTDGAYEALTWGRLDAIAAVSDDVARTFASAVPVNPAKIVVIENILSSSFVRSQADSCEVSGEMPMEPGVARLCSVGRFTHQKGFDLAIEAADRLRASGRRFRWYLVGYGPDEPMLRAAIDGAGLGGTVIILGKKTNPYPYMKACDIYVQPSRYEGKSVCVREAQMLGKPVLITNFPTAAAQLEHDVDGYITECGVEGIVRGLERLMDDPALARRLATCAAARSYENLGEVSKVIGLWPTSRRADA